MSSQSSCTLYASAQAERWCFNSRRLGVFGEAGGLRGGVRGGVRQGGTGGCSPLAIRASSSSPTNDALSRKAACRASSLGSGRLLFSQRLKSSIRAASPLHAAQADVKSLIDAFASAIDAFCALAAHLLCQALRAMLGLAWPAVITTTDYDTIDPESTPRAYQGLLIPRWVATKSCASQSQASVL